MIYLKAPEEQTRSDREKIRRVVSEILLAIERDGAAAVRAYSEQFDRWSPESFVLSAEEIARTADLVDPELRAHIDFAREQVRSFAALQRETLSDLDVETLPGVRLGHRHIPVGAVGSYSPGGRYPMIASSLMTLVTPKAAGVERVVGCAPPRGRTSGIDAAQLYAISSSGADQVLCLGGVQALAAMAFGVEDVEPVDMIVGPGNAYVAEAKRQLFGVAGIDLLAGPTEILILADDSTDAELVAADLLGQAEHGETSPAILVTDSEAFGTEVIQSVDSWLKSWPTAEVAGEAWRQLGAVIVCEDREEMVRASDEIAAEHLELQTRDDDWMLARLRNYGTAFVGKWSTVAYSDKVAGPNHVLPTNRAARYTGGLWVGNFLKTVTYQSVNKEGTAQLARATEAICEAEGMLGHGLTARIRRERAMVRDPPTRFGADHA